MVGYPRAFLMLKPFYHKKNCLSSLLAPCCAPFFVKRNPLAFPFSSLAGKLTSRGSRRRRYDAPHRAKSLFRSIIKTRQNKSGFYGGETGICSCLLQSSPCIFMLCKSLRSAAKNDAPCRFLNALVQIPVVKCRKTKTDKRVCLSVLFGGETGI